MHAPRLGFRLGVAPGEQPDRAAYIQGRDDPNTEGTLAGDQPRPVSASSVSCQEGRKWSPTSPAETDPVSRFGVTEANGDPSSARPKLRCGPRSDNASLIIPTELRAQPAYLPQTAAAPRPGARARLTVRRQCLPEVVIVACCKSASRLQTGQQQDALLLADISGAADAQHHASLVGWSVGRLTEGSKGPLAAACRLSKVTRVDSPRVTASHHESPRVTVALPGSQRPGPWEGMSVLSAPSSIAQCQEDRSVSEGPESRRGRHEVLGGPRCQADLVPVPRWGAVKLNEKRMVVGPLVQRSGPMSGQNGSGPWGSVISYAGTPMRRAKRGEARRGGRQSAREAVRPRATVTLRAECCAGLDLCVLDAGVGGRTGPDTGTVAKKGSRSGE